MHASPPNHGLHPLQKPFAVLGLLVLCLSSAGCYQSTSRTSDLSPIVGTWVVKVPEGVDVRTNRYLKDAATLRADLAKF